MTTAPSQGEFRAHLDVARTCGLSRAYLVYWLKPKVAVVAHQPLMPGICNVSSTPHHLSATALHYHSAGSSTERHRSLAYPIV